MTEEKSEKSTSKQPPVVADDDYISQRVVNVAMSDALLEEIDNLGEYLSKKQYRRFTRAEVVRHLAQYGIRRWVKMMEANADVEEPALAP